MWCAILLPLFFAFLSFPCLLSCLLPISSQRLVQVLSGLGVGEGGSLLTVNTLSVDTQHIDALSLLDVIRSEARLLDSLARVGVPSTRTNSILALSYVSCSL